MTSGAMYRYVPVSPVRTVAVSTVNLLERPMSATRAAPLASNRTLVGLRSRCMTCGSDSCRACMPRATSSDLRSRADSGALLGGTPASRSPWSQDLRVPPGIHSVRTQQRCGGSSTAPMKGSTKGCRMELITSTSRRKLMISSLASTRTDLRATWPPCQVAWYVTPKVPLPASGPSSTIVGSTSQPLATPLWRSSSHSFWSNAWERLPDPVTSSASCSVSCSVSSLLSSSAAPWEGGARGGRIPVSSPPCRRASESFWETSFARLKAASFSCLRDSICEVSCSTSRFKCLLTSKAVSSASTSSSLVLF
mmetsp:Transcript_22481/g.53784  ORF Transcript_22481/g.53784 Transcript_22481/m.53784 type:complete len:308 (+) Transcript_22481:1848-2771(+)